MIQNPVFLDTFALLALASQSDQWHGRAKSIEAGLTKARTPLATSDWVLAEFLDSSSPVALRAPACRIVHRLQSSARTTIVEADRAAWREAFALYEQRPDKDWSFVDCASMLICQSRGISRVFTHDRHFAQAGFDLLLP